MRREPRRLLYPLLALALSGCSWFTDFKQQPKMDPWESEADTIAMRANPQYSVPVYGSAAPGFAYDRAPTIAAVNTMSGLSNPVAADERSLRNGRMQYEINCAVCHGLQGAGDGPVAQFGFPPFPIGATSPTAPALTDGQIFGIIRNGRGLMPSYNRIEEPERWDLINYLRTLQRGGAAQTPSPLGRPGETGTKLPGGTLTAPTRPAPHYRPLPPDALMPAPAPAAPTPQP